MRLLAYFSGYLLLLIAVNQLCVSEDSKEWYFLLNQILILNSTYFTPRLLVHRAMHAPLVGYIEQLHPTLEEHLTEKARDWQLAVGHLKEYSTATDQFVDLFQIFVREQIQGTCEEVSHDKRTMERIVRDVIGVRVAKVAQGVPIYLGIAVQLRK